jgi:hypothetical protein
MHDVGKTMNPHNGFGSFVLANVSQSAWKVVALELIQKGVNQRMTDAKQRSVFPPHGELAVKSCSTVHAINLGATYAGGDVNSIELAIREDCTTQPG